MIRPLAYYGNPVLRKKGARVEAITDELRELVRDMFETMHAHNGIGLAAPQISLSLTLFVTQVPHKVNDDPNDNRWEEGVPKVFINPKILAFSEEHWTADEGCISIPGLYGNVTRPLKIKVTATNLDGETFEEELFGLDARCFMHENDHINGVLYIDRLESKERKKMEPKLNEIKKKYRQ